MLIFVMMHWLRYKWTVITMSLFTLLICYSRVYLGYHYPGDILGGFVLAAITVCLMVWIHTRYMHFERVTNPKYTWMPTFFVSIILLLFIGASV